MHGEILKILIDTGSNKNYIQPSLIKLAIPNEKPFYANSAGGKLKISHHTFINLFGLRAINLKFFALPNLKSFHAILGNDSLKQLSAVIYTDRNLMVIKNNIKIKLKQYISENVNNISQTPENIPLRTEHMTERQEIRLKELVAEFPNLFAEPNKRLTYTTTVKGEIRTTTDNPVYSRCYPYPTHLKDVVEQQIQELLEQGIIRPSKSPYNSPVWVVPKKMDASGLRRYRVVIDYRKLNNITVILFPKLMKCCPN